MKKAINTILMLSLVIISFNCKNVITDSKLKMIKDSLSNKAEYYDPEYTNKQLMLKCWLDFKSETIVEFIVATYTTEDISQGFHEADRKVFTGKYTVNKDNNAYYLDMEFKDKEINANAMQIVGFSYQMVDQTVNLPSKIIITTDSANHVILENWVETNLPVKEEKPVEQTKISEPEPNNTVPIADTQHATSQNTTPNTVQPAQAQPTQQPEEQQSDAQQKYYNGCGYSYESKKDCMDQCGHFNGGTCPEGPATGKIIKSSSATPK